MRRGLGFVDEIAGMMLETFDRAGLMPVHDLDRIEVVKVLREYIRYAAHRERASTRRSFAFLTSALDERDRTWLRGEMNKHFKRRPL